MAVVNMFDINKYTILTLMTLVVNSGCTNKQVYENIQRDAIRECRKLPATDYEECLKSHSESFKSYTQKREELIK